MALPTAFESSQPGLEARRGKSKLLKAGSDHRLGKGGWVEGRKNDVNSEDALPEDRAWS